MQKKEETANDFVFYYCKYAAIKFSLRDPLIRVPQNRDVWLCHSILSLLLHHSSCDACDTGRPSRLRQPIGEKKQKNKWNELTQLPKPDAPL